MARAKKPHLLRQKFYVKGVGGDRLLQNPLFSEESVQYFKGKLYESLYKMELGIMKPSFPQHEFHLDEYWISKYPVTNRIYKAFISNTDHSKPLNINDKVVDNNSHPVVDVSWYDARAFCKWAREVSNRRIRLPTESEWEKAARGVDGRYYPWGNQKPDDSLFNYNYFTLKTTTPVGNYSPAGDSPYGCTDMIGNVWQWTSSLLGANFLIPKYKFPYNEKDGRENLDAGDDVYRIVRGGSCLDRSMMSVERNFLVFNRGKYLPDFINGDIGFRCALTM